THADPFCLPDGAHALFTIRRGEEAQLAIVDLARRAYKPLRISGAHAVFVQPGFLAFRRGTSLLAARFDLSSLEVTGEAIPVLENVRLGPYVASDGTMLYVPERGDSSARLVLVDRDGRPSPIQGERL